MPQVRYAQPGADQIQIRNAQSRDARHETVTTQSARRSRGYQLRQHRTERTVEQLDFFIERHLLQQQARAFIRGQLWIHPGAARALALASQYKRSKCKDGKKENAKDSIVQMHGPSLKQARGNSSCIRYSAQSPDWKTETTTNHRPPRLGARKARVTATSQTRRREILARLSDN